MKVSEGCSWESSGWRVPVARAHEYSAPYPNILHLSSSHHPFFPRVSKSLQLGPRV